MASRCIYCGMHSHAEDWNKYPELKEEFERNHGPGRCVSSCSYCRQGIPHSYQACGDPEHAGPEVRDFTRRQMREKLRQPISQ